ncbi:MAG TPA: acyltransferase [Pelobium sp.]|nr:acyltransferase [Pelobium sp.]
MFRLKELDNLRGFAALNVVVYHYTARFREVYHHNYPSKFDWNYGHYGVELFFIISGFVIFMTLHKVKDIKEFTFKRFARLYPTYWICILITLIATGIFQYSKVESYSTVQLLVNFTMLQEIVKQNSIDGVYWSLLPELFFYVFIGFFYAIGWLSKVRFIAFFWLSVMVANQLGLLPFGAYALNAKYGMFFLAGILFYQLKFNKGNWIEHLLILCCLLTGIWTHRSPETWYVFTGIFALFYLFIYDQLKVISCKPLLFLGYVSYPLYLLHQNIGFYVMNRLKPYISQDYIIIIITMSFLIGLAWLVTKFLEKPILSYLNGKLKSQPRTSNDRSFNDHSLDFLKNEEISVFQK